MTGGIAEPLRPVGEGGGRVPQSEPGRGNERFRILDHKRALGFDKQTQDGLLIGRIELDAKIEERFAGGKRCAWTGGIRLLIRRIVGVGGEV